MNPATTNGVMNTSLAPGVSPTLQPQNPAFPGVTDPNLLWQYLATQQVASQAGAPAATPAAPVIPSWVWIAAVAAGGLWLLSKHD